MKTRIFRTLILFGLGLSLLFTNITLAVATPEVMVAFQEDTQTATIEAFTYLCTQMNEDGGVRWMDENSSLPVTIKVILALTAGGYPQDFLMSSSGNRPIDFLAANVSQWLYDPVDSLAPLNLARAGQVLTALAAANENPHDFGQDGLDLVHEVKANFDPSSGVFGQSTSENVTDQVWSILGLAANHAAILPDAAAWLVNAQRDDGSWNDGYGSFLDTTPLGILALLASGHITPDSAAVQKALSFLADHQQTTGGWKTEWDTADNASTTGMIMQAILATGSSSFDAQWENTTGNPLTALLALQQENGAIGGDYVNAYSTADALLGLSEKPLFDLGIIRQVNRAFDFITANQGSDGGWGTVGQTLDVLLALKSAGWDPNTVTTDDQTPAAFIQANLAEYILSGSDAIGKSLIGAIISGEDPTNFSEINLVDEMLSTYSTETNAFGDEGNTYHQAFAILGLFASNQEIPEGALNTLLALQQNDGGWEYSAGFGVTPDSTALAIQALLAAGVPIDDASISRAIDYLHTTQTAEGDWGDASTTSFVLMALNALGETMDSWVSTSGKTPRSALPAYQKNNGAFHFNRDYPDDSLMATASALVAQLSGSYLVRPDDNKTAQYAGLVVIPDVGESQTSCVTFTEPAISGMDLLESSGFAYDAQDGFINSILGFSNPQGDTMYWSYWYWDGREWQFNNTGANQANVTHSQVEAWHFVSWELFPSLPPRYLPNLSEICKTVVLKDYTLQPFISYQDYALTQSVPNITNSLSETPEDFTATETPSTTDKPASIAPEAEITPDQAPLPAQADSEQPDEQRSMVPLLIIGTGLVVLVVLYLFSKLKTRA